MIHQYKLNGFNIVIDGNSGNIHTVDDLAYDMIGMFELYSRDEVISRLCDKYGSTVSDTEECYEDILALKDSGKLFADDTFSPFAAEFKKRGGNIIKALCLHVAHTCNLRCSYCFAGQGRFNGAAALMSPETGKRAIDFLIENSGTRRNLEVDFFGGEPLMNFEVCKQIVAYARSVEKAAGKNFRFTLTTNGLLIDDDVIDFCNRECHNVVLSLDGRKEVNDRFRVDSNGKGSFDTIVPKFRKLVKARGNRSYYMRGTFTHYNPDFLNDVKTMLDLGFTELSMEPVVCSEDSESALTPQDRETVKRQYEELALLMLKRQKEGRPFTFYHYMLDLTGGPCIYKRISGCGSGTEYMAVTPSGDLYPCHQFVGDEKFLLGNVFSGVKNDRLREEFRECNVYSRQKCLDCWARLWCAGGCAANAYHATGSVSGVYESGCDLFRKRLECAVMMKIASGDTLSSADCDGCEGCS